MDATEMPRLSTEDNSFASVAMSSPATSVFSKGHMSKSSASSLSIASSPNPRESLDLFGPRLGKVAEEQEKDGLVLDQDLAHSPNSSNDYNLYFASENEPSPTSPGLPAEHTTGKHTDLSAVSLDHFHAKRQRSGDHGSSLHQRLSNRFGSMSRRLKNRSESGLPLSIVTHMSAPPSRAGSTSSPQFVSPAMSAISKHESYLPPSPAQETMQISFPEYDEDEDMEDVRDRPQATTPLLPPAFAGHLYEDTPIQSPLQSPSIAPTAAALSSNTSPNVGPLPVAGLPSPPLSTKQSLVSMQQRSGANTAAAPIAEIPPLQLSGQDQWSQALGHANFNILPEPYLPEVINVETYLKFRSNWDVARRNYAKHLARTSEHYGSTSRVFKLTIEKWTVTDTTWKAHHNELQNVIGLQITELKRISDKSQNSQNSLTNFALEKPVSRIAIPEIDYKCGKFPELGDGDIVSPMEVAPPRAASMAPYHSPSSPRKRSLFRFLHDMFGKA